MTPDPEVLAEIRRGVTRLAHRLRAERPVEALSATKVAVLSHLDRRGPSTPGEIAAAEHHQPQSLTRVFAELQLARLISRRPSPRDGRESLLAITPAGRAALARDMRSRDAWLAAALAGLRQTDLDVLRIAARIMDELAEATPAATHHQVPIAGTRDRSARARGRQAS